MAEDGNVDSEVTTARKREAQLDAPEHPIVARSNRGGQLRALPTIDKFILTEPLYERFTYDPKHETLLRLIRASSKIDGHCTSCRRETTFNVSPQYLGYALTTAFEQSKGFFEITATCARNEKHNLIVYFMIAASSVIKIGQWPSLADILLDELKPLRSAINKQDAAELHKAIGLAAHGVGVGSYVYLRRVFERLIFQSFEANKDAVGLEHENFQRLRMPDKIEKLRDHLPPFLVKHRDVYGQLSDGIHNLSEEECLAYFDVFKGAVFLMLKQESERRIEAKAEEDLSKAIAAATNRVTSK
jgi:hypothetical protein